MIEDLVGLTGMLALVGAYLMNLTGRLRSDALAYKLMNLYGAGIWPGTALSGKATSSWHWRLSGPSLRFSRSSSRVPKIRLKLLSIYFNES